LRKKTSKQPKAAQAPIFIVIFCAFIQRQDFPTPTIDKEPLFYDEDINLLINIA
jgi:hypothetical protein